MKNICNPFFSLFKRLFTNTNEKTNFWGYALIYLIWLTLNVWILIGSNKLTAMDNRLDYFYPFSTYHYCSYLWEYDLSEFIVYSFLLPIGLLLIQKIIVSRYKDNAQRRGKTVFRIFIVYCFVFAIVSLLDCYEIIVLYAAIFKVAINIYIAYYMVNLIFDLFSDYRTKK